MCKYAQIFAATPKPWLLGRLSEMTVNACQPIGSLRWCVKVHWILTHWLTAALPWMWIQPAPPLPRSTKHGFLSVWLYVSAHKGMCAFVNTWKHTKAFSFRVAALWVSLSYACRATGKGQSPAGWSCFPAWRSWIHLCYSYKGSVCNMTVFQIAYFLWYTSMQYPFYVVH